MIEELGIKALEHTTVKIPYENLNKRFRNAQKVFDKEMTSVQQACKQLEACVKDNESSPATIEQTVSELNNVISKLQSMKRKSAEAIEDEYSAGDKVRKRLDHLETVVSGDGHEQSSKLDEWNRMRLERMIVDYLLRLGCYQTAIMTARHSGIEELTNIEMFMVAKEVEESLTRHETTTCLNWCSDNRSRLRKIKSSLEVEVRKVEFIELIVKNERMKAIKHAKKHFSPLDMSANPSIQQVMTLLAFSTDIQVQPYKDLLDTKLRWTNILELFRTENFRIYQLSSEPVFSATLQAGLSALKTSKCYNSNQYKPNISGGGHLCDAHSAQSSIDGVGGDATISSDTSTSVGSAFNSPVPSLVMDITGCPVCHQHLNQIAKHLPYAHQSQSRLMCSLSGQPINEHNPPLMLPNGHVYGRLSLLEMLINETGEVVCPKTKQTFSLDDTSRVYIM